MEKPFTLSVKALVVDDQQRCLVLRRSPQSNNNPGLWDLPGGKCDPGESLADALRREVAEETGLQVHLTRVVGSTQVELAERVVAYLILEAQASGGEVALSDEHDLFQWQPRKRLAELDYPSQFRDFLKGYAAGAKETKPTQPRDWYREQIEWFRQVRPTYEVFALCLEKILNQAGASLGLHGIVQARAKTIASFAEKIVRKNYSDPQRQMTDLCGARVILHTLSGVTAFCRYVENHFQVFGDDSGDKLDSLAASEFGYLSRHYIIEFKRGVFPAELVPEPLLGLKAELQVRTILQHAWADINHELSYKNRFRLPRRWQRDFARLAAALEEADRDFDSIRVGLEEYAVSYDASFPSEQMREEMEKLAVVLHADPDNTAVAQRLAKLAMSLGDWDRAIAVLRPLATSGPAGLLRDLGVCLCKRQRRTPAHAEFAEGQGYLQQAVERDPTDVDAWASLGGAWRTKENAARSAEERTSCRRQARDHYQRAFAIDPGNPFPLGNYIEYELADHPELDIVSFFQPSLEAASRRCRLQAEVGVNLPWAYFDLGKFQMFLQSPSEALGYYARGVALSNAAFFLESALGSFTTLAVARQRLPGFDWCRQFLQLALALRFGKGAAEAPAAPARLSGPVAILAGYTDRPLSAAHRSLLREAFQGFSGTVMSGGTEAGISAAAGEFQATCGTAIRTIGYLPNQLPAGVRADARYGELRRSGGDDFSPLEPLLYWSEVQAAGVPLSQVKLLCVGGGRLAAVECQLALALGVPVGLLDAADSEVTKRLAAHPWAGHPLVQTLPPEPAGLRIFLSC